METKFAISFLLETKVDPTLHTGIQHNYDVGLGDTVRPCGRRTNFNELHTSCPLDSFFFEVGSWDLVLHKDEFHTNPHTFCLTTTTTVRVFVICERKIDTLFVTFPSLVFFIRLELNKTKIIRDLTHLSVLISTV